MPSRFLIISTFALCVIFLATARAGSPDREPGAILKSVESDAESLNVAGRMEILLNLARFYETLHQDHDADRIYGLLARTVRESPVSDVVNSDYVPELGDLLEDAGDAKDKTRPERPDPRVALNDPKRILSHSELRQLAVDLRVEVIERELSNPDGGRIEPGDAESNPSTGLEDLAEMFEDKPEYAPRVKAAIKSFSHAPPELQTVSRASALAELLIRNHNGKREEDSYLDLAGLYADRERDQADLAKLRAKPKPDPSDAADIEKLEDSIGEDEQQIKSRLADEPDWVDPRFKFDLRTKIDFACSAAALAAKAPVDSAEALALIQRLDDHFVFIDVQTYCPLDLQEAAREAAVPPRLNQGEAREALEARCPLPKELKELIGSEKLTSGAVEVTDYLFPYGDAPPSLTPEPPKEDECARNLAVTLDIQRDTVINHELPSCTEPLGKSPCFDRYRRRSAYLLDRNAFELLTSITTRNLVLNDPPGAREILETMTSRLAVSHHFDPLLQATFWQNRQQAGELDQVARAYGEYAHLTWKLDEPDKVLASYEELVGQVQSIPEARVRDLALIKILEALMHTHAKDLDFELAHDG